MLPASKDESAPVPEMTAAAPAPSDLVVCARYDACLPACVHDVYVTAEGES